MFRYSLTSVLLFLSLDYAELTNSSLDHEWDVLLFTQSWPETVCREWKEHGSTHTCTLPKKQNSWSIHGIWPTKLGTIGPQFCNKTWLFDPEEIRPIESNLMQDWINVKTDTSTYAFWAHEWNKHGTCAASDELFNSQIKYFSNGIQLLHNYSMGNILDAAKITPSDDKEYSVADINKAIINKLGENAHIECAHEKGKQYLTEIRLCFKKNLELTTCKGTEVMGEDYGDDILTNCNISQGVMYPQYEKPPKKVLVQLHKLVTWLQWFTL